jgi:hypothetical protein
MVTFKSSQQLDRDIEAFMAGYSWEQIYRLWSSRLDDFGVTADPLFKVVELHVPSQADYRQPDIVWCPRKSFTEEIRKYQDHFDHCPKSQGPTHAATTASQGEFQTLKLLHKHRNNPHKVAAIFICASLFTRVESPRRNYPETWPKAPCVKALLDAAYAVWREGSEGWHHACTQVLPYMSDDYCYGLESLHALIRYLAEEHAAVLLNYTPTELVFVSKRSPSVRSV